MLIDTDRVRDIIEAAVECGGDFYEIDPILSEFYRLLDLEDGVAGEQQAMITAFRHAANSLGKATGVIISHVEHDEAAKSVTGDHYFLELLAESELRYKRLKAAADAVIDSRNSLTRSIGSINALKEALK